MNHSSGTVNQECEACAQAKMHKIPFPKKTSRAFELIHSDLCGPMNVESIGGNKYVLTFTDDYKRYVTVYFLKSKSEVLSKFEQYVNMVENATGQRVQHLLTDNGGEYVSQNFRKFCASKGIFHQFTNPYTPEQNGILERLNRTLTESAKSMIFHAKVHLNCWAEAVNTAVYLHNRSPISSLTDGTPYEHWFGQKPNVSNLKIFGSICFVHTPDNLRQKLDPKSRKAIFVGHPTNTKGYKVYDLESKNFVRSRNVLFHKNKLVSKYLTKRQSWSKMMSKEDLIRTDSSLLFQENLQLIQLQPIMKRMSQQWELHLKKILCDRLRISFQLGRGNH